jgi:uncharacterized protein (DUF927 family)
MVGLVNMMAASGHLPLILDDTKNVADPSLIPRVLYAITEGMEHSKGKKDGGNQSQATWHNILITSGETSITSIGSKSGGAAARVIEIRGKAFSGTATDIAPMMKDIGRHYGHLIPRIAAWILEDCSRTLLLQDLREQYIHELNDTIKGGVESRMNENLASLKVGAYVCNEVGMGVNFDGAIAEARECVGRSANTADRLRDAMDKLFAFAMANESGFYGRRKDGSYGSGIDGSPHGGWIGAWAYGNGYTNIAFLSSTFTSVMKREGFHPDDILLALEQAGYRIKDGNRDPNNSLMNARLITIRAEAFK